MAISAVTAHPIRVGEPTVWTVVGWPRGATFVNSAKALEGWPSGLMLSMTGELLDDPPPHGPYWTLGVGSALPAYEAKVLAITELRACWPSTDPTAPPAMATMSVDADGFIIGGIVATRPLTSADYNQLQPVLARMWAVDGARRGRPRGSGQWRSRAELEVALRGVLGGYAHDQKRPTAVELAVAIGVSPRHLRREVARLFGCKLDDLIESLQ